jgi:hypothetical protein
MKTTERYNIFYPNKERTDHQIETRAQVDKWVSRMKDRGVVLRIVAVRIDKDSASKVYSYTA